MVLEAELVWESSLLRSLWWPGLIFPRKLLRRFEDFASSAGRGESFLETNPVLARCSMAGIVIISDGVDGASKGALARYWPGLLMLCMNLLCDANHAREQAQRATVRELLAAISSNSCTRKTGPQSHRDDGEEKDAGVRPVTLNWRPV